MKNNYFRIIVFAFVAVAMITAGITAMQTQTAQADKVKVYCGPEPSTEEGCAGVEGSNQESQEGFGENTKNRCETVNEQISGEETKCRKLD